jgi:hypothetical protein
VKRSWQSPLEAKPKLGFHVGVMPRLAFNLQRFIALGLLLALASGCSSFHSEWRRAGAAPERPGTLTGRWEGRWTSDYNGHNGKLRCLISQDSDARYAARFRASYLGVLRFEYTVPLQVTQESNRWTFQGEADLGKLAGGVYHYDGAITDGTNFHSSYRAEVDHGFFQMQKVPARQ